MRRGPIISSVGPALTESQPHSNALLEQKRLLEQKTTRAAFRKVEQDSASLIVLRDTSSYRSTLTDSLSKLSWVFGFDDELNSSRVYGRAWRNNLRKTRQLEEALKVFSPTAEEPEIPESGNQEVKVLLLGGLKSNDLSVALLRCCADETAKGTNDASKTTMFKQIRGLCQGTDLAEETRNDYKPMIFNTICELVWALEREIAKLEGVQFSPQVQVR